LPIIPIEKIDLAWDHIFSLWNKDNPAVVDLVRYIERTWLSATGVTLFSRETWCQYGVLRIRTNNAAEGFHCKLNRRINKSRPSFWEVATVIKQI
jgi:hypothetical protein